MLFGASVGGSRAHRITVENDVLGQAIRRDESAPGGAGSVGGDPHEIWYRFDGRELGYTGNNGTLESDYATSIATRTAAAQTGAFRNASTGGPVADFDEQYTGITSFTQGAAGGSYTVRAGDSLPSIAAALWGDANLWYKLAAANGLSAGASLAVGTTLQVPNGVNRSSNSASTFKPYDPSDAYGDTSPTTPTPKAAKNHKCGAFGQILLVAVAVAVTAIAPFGGGVVGGIANGALASTVSQGVGIATGIQDKFSFKGVALAAIAGGVGGGLSTAGGLDKVGGSTFLGNAARGAIGSAVSQGIGVATGLQSKFNFAGVAAAGIGAGLAGAITGNNATPNFGTRLAANTAGGIANAAVRSVFDGTSFGDNLLAALPDVIGNTIGGIVADAVLSRGNTPRREAQASAQALREGGAASQNLLPGTAEYDRYMRETKALQGEFSDRIYQARQNGDFDALDGLTDDIAQKFYGVSGSDISGGRDLINRLQGEVIVKAGGFAYGDLPDSTLIRSGYVQERIDSVAQSPYGRAALTILGVGAAIAVPISTLAGVAIGALAEKGGERVQTRFDAVGYDRQTASTAGRGFVLVAGVLGGGLTSKIGGLLKSGFTSVFGRSAAERGGVDLALTYKPEWSAAQRAEADLKVRILTESETVVTQATRSGTSAGSRYRSAGNQVPAGKDVDHIRDLQLGGADTLLNMRPLDASVNRSLGAQIQQRIKNLPPGTVVNKVTIRDR